MMLSVSCTMLIYTGEHSLAGETMISTVDETWRYDLAVKLSDIRFLQELSLSKMQKLVLAFGSSPVLAELQALVSDDQQLLGEITNVLFQFGPPGEEVAGLPLTSAMPAGGSPVLSEELTRQIVLKQQFILLVDELAHSALGAGSHVASVIAPTIAAREVSQAHIERLGVLLVGAASEEVGDLPTQTGLDPDGWLRSPGAVAAAS